MKTNGRESRVSVWLLLLEACKAWICFVLHPDFGEFLIRLVWTGGISHLLLALWRSVLRLLSPLRDQSAASVVLTLELWQPQLLPVPYFPETTPTPPATHRLLQIYPVTPFLTSVSHLWYKPTSVSLLCVCMYRYTCIYIYIHSWKTVQ